jgi:uncharacterized membrane protein YidH (DUF202 family)
MKQMSLATILVLGLVGLLLGMALPRGWDRVSRSIRRSGRLPGLTVLAVYQLVVGSLFAMLTTFVALFRDHPL